MQRTKQELIDLIKDKQDNAEMAYKRAICNEDNKERIKNKAYMPFLRYLAYP